jgi:hypothetical protein
MATIAPASTSRRPAWLTPIGLLLAAGLASAAFAWWMIAITPLTFGNITRHSGHFTLTWLHVVGGSGMLLFGGINLYLAFAKRHYALHRWSGRLYLTFGVVGAGTAMWVSLTMAHKDAGTSVFSNQAVSLLTLAAAWAAFAGLGWRAVLNRRFSSHGQWMIRSYVLAWAFTLCRIASDLAGADQLGGGQAFIWLSWVAPMILCEIGLQWREGARRPHRSGT